MNNSLLDAKLHALSGRIDTLEADPDTGFTVAGTGLTATGDTVNAIAHADGSIIVNANDIQVGVINATQHGVLAGGTTHANAIAAGAAGFMTGADKTKLDGITAGAAPLTVKDEGSNLSTAVVSLDFVGGGVTATGTTAVTVTIPKGGGLTVGAVGSSANANGCTLSSGALNLEPASASFPGVVTTAAQGFAGDKAFSGSVSVGNSTTPGYQLDMGTPLANTKIALYNAGGNPAGIGLQGGDVRFHGTSGAGTFTFRQTASSSAGVSIDWATGAITMGAGSTMGAVALLSQTNSVSGITSKTFTSPTFTGVPVMSGGPTINGACSFSNNIAFTAGIFSSFGDRFGQRVTTATTVTVGTGDSTIFLDCTSGAVTVNLPALSGQGSGRFLRFVKIDSTGNAATITRASTDTINGATTYVLAAQWDFVVIQGAGTASTFWYVVGK